MSRAGARTGLQLLGHGDMMEFDSSSPALAEKASTPLAEIGRGKGWGEGWDREGREGGALADLPAEGEVRRQRPLAAGHACDCARGGMRVRILHSDIRVQAPSAATSGTAGMHLSEEQKRAFPRQISNRIWRARRIRKGHRRPYRVECTGSLSTSEVKRHGCGLY